MGGKGKPRALHVDLYNFATSNARYHSPRAESIGWASEEILEFGMPFVEARLALPNNRAQQAAPLHTKSAKPPF